MTVETVQPDELEAAAFESGLPIQMGRHTARLALGDRVLVARIPGGPQIRPRPTGGRAA